MTKEFVIKACDLHIGYTILLTGVPFKIRGIRKSITDDLVVVTLEDGFSFDARLDDEYIVEEL